MATIQEVIKELCRLGITGITVEYDQARESLYYDLNTQAKSHLHLYENFSVFGRYDYEGLISPNQPIDEVVADLFREFEGCIRHRDYYNSDWMELGVKIGCKTKEVKTHTTVEYR